MQCEFKKKHVEMRRSSHGLCVVQAEDRPILRDTRGYRTNSATGSLGATGFATLLETNRALCAADLNCTYVRHDGAYKDIEPHWRKVFIGSMVLNTTSCPHVVWLDSDSVLSGRPSDLLALLRPRAGSMNGPDVEDRRYVWPQGVSSTSGSRPGDLFHMAASGEGDLYNHNLSPFNAGVWIVANTKLGRAIMSKWVSVYTEHAAARWTRDPQGKHTGQDDLSWKCTQPEEHAAHLGTRRARPCGFSQEYYEQGAFVRHVLALPRFRHAIRLVPWYVLQSIHPHPMVHHFIGPPRTKDKHMNAYLRFRGPGQGQGAER